MNKQFEHDILIIGSGAAGLTTALHLAPHASIGILSKGTLTAANTYYAQGGVAAVLDEDDSIEAHIEDTLNAGTNLCHESAVRFTVENGPTAIRWLIDQGVGFTMSPQSNGQQEYHLTKEGGHSHRRVIHAADATGFAISNTLIDKVQQHSHVSVFESRVAIDLITTRKLRQIPNNTSNCVLGAYVLNRETGDIETHKAKYVILASGGASKTYLYTSNPDIATGDGIAMAWRAGCRVANMEFNQFHPTCLYHPDARSFLVTEAVRGEGGYLKLPNGERFMHRFDERKELAPRDIVARAIDHEMKRLGVECLYLDISHKPADFIKSHFPTVYERCKELGIDITKAPIPIVPAAHYTCGGVITDQQGHTDVEGLYAIGETAFTGLHGANRMASNSLLECLVYAISASKDIKAKLSDTKHPIMPDIPAWDESQVTDSDEDVVISHNWDELRRFMWDYVGIVRTDKRLARALHRVELLQREISEYYSNYKISNDLIELRNLVLVGELIIRSALKRKESRGLHFTLDYPNTLPEAKDTILTPGD